MKWEFEFICFLLMVFTLGVFLGILIATPTVTAMDVYQGKTTLEITYRDGIPIDSVVVYKDKKK